MAGYIYSLYPNYSYQSDRRQQNIPVDVDRRSGLDRRQAQRPCLDLKLKQDIDKVRDTFTSIAKSKGELLAFAESSIPGLRRIETIEENKESHNPFKAAGLGVIGVINLKEDLRDLLTIAGKSKILAGENCYSKFGFFVGTPFEPWLKKSETGRFILTKVDGTLGDTNIFNNLFKLLKVDVIPAAYKKEITYLGGATETVLRRGIEVEGSSVGKLMALASHKIPKLSLAVLLCLEIPSILKAAKNDKCKQTINSVINVAFGVSCGALLCALFTPVNPALSVMGLGAGYYLGNKLSKYIENKLNLNVQSNAS